ncbi:MAG: glycosyltransferase, partial [Gemmatimonadetes bacterium]|nr:glycosyltransferase [Gemmatimonadota bacterium]
MRRFLLPIAMVLVDLFALNASFVTALYLRFHDYKFSSWAPSFLYSYTYLLIAVNLIHLVLLLYFKEIQFPRRFKPTYVLPRIGRIVLITLLASVLIIFLSKGLSRSHQVFHFSRPTLIAFWILSFFYLSAGRFLFGIWQLWLFDRGLMQRPVIVIGEGRLRDDLATRIKFNRWFGARVVETITVAPPADVEGEGAQPARAGLVAGPDALREHLREKRVGEVFLATDPDDFAQIFAVLDTCRSEHIKVRMVPDHLQLLISHLLLSESVAVPNRTKEDLIYEVYQVVDSRFALDLATIAILGSKGIPPTFGGIEHHVSHLAHRLAGQGFRIKVYARSYYTQLEGRYQGLEIIRLPSVYTKHLDAISHTALATLHMMLQPVDVAHYHAQGPSIFALLPRLFGIRTVTTVHGLDWKREKWGSFAKRCLQIGEYASARFPTRTIAVSR